MLVVVVLVALAAGPDLSPPGWATVVTFAVQLAHSLPRTRWVRSWWTLAIQAAVFPWAGLPGFLAGSVLLVAPARVRWVLFAAVAVAAGLTATTSVYECANAVGNAVAQGLVVYALTRLDELRAELHARRDELASRSVDAEREQVTRELEGSLGGALSAIARGGRRDDPARISALARDVAERIRSRVGSAAPAAAVDDRPPRAMAPVMVTVHAVYLAVAALYVAEASPPAPMLVRDLALLTAVVGLQLHHSFPRASRGRPRLLAVTLPVQTGLACLAVVLPGPPHPQLVGLAAGAVLIQLPARFAWPAAGILLAALVPALALRGVPPAMLAGAVLDAAVTALIFHGTAQATRLVQEIRQVRADLAAVAVARERQRIARDVHDLLGRGMSAIAISTAAGSPADDVAALARGSLADLRAIPRGAVRVRLDAELADARAVLASAGVPVTVRIGHSGLSGPVDALLGTVLREAVTNVLRHGGGRWAAIETGRDPVLLRVTNDRAARPTSGPPGRGIANLTTRARELGATLTATEDGGGFALTVTR